MFEPIELRKQCKDNRQSSTEMLDSDDWPELMENVTAFLKRSNILYNKLISSGVAREQARMILPMCTKTKIHMTGSIRSWIHFLELRDDEHAQKEIQLVAKEVRSYLSKELPIIFGND
jgi:thymidylate synthase (FAD)